MKTCYPGTCYTFVERHNSTGKFLPGYASAIKQDPQINFLLRNGLLLVDHCEANQPDGQTEPVVDWCTNALGFHRFWSVGDK